MDNQLTQQFHALADLTRLSVVERLLEGPCSVSELAEPYSMALPPFMKHLRVLEDAGLVQSRKSGRVRTFSVRSSALDDMHAWLSDRRRLWRLRLSKLEEHLSENGGADDHSS